MQEIQNPPPQLGRKLLQSMSDTISRGEMGPEAAVLIEPSQSATEPKGRNANETWPPLPPLLAPRQDNRHLRHWFSLV